MKYLKTILFIDDEYLHDIRIKMNNNEKVVHLVTYLIKENRITLYKSFISIWKILDPAKATQFEEFIKRKINDQGLAEVDDEFQIVPFKSGVIQKSGMTTYTYLIYRFFISLSHIILIFLICIFVYVLISQFSSFLE